MPFYRPGEDSGDGGHSVRTEAAEMPLQALVEEVGAVRGRVRAKHLKERAGEAVKKVSCGRALLAAKNDKEGERWGNSEDTKVS